MAGEYRQDIRVGQRLIARDTRRAVARVVTIAVMMQSVNNTAFAVKPIGNYIEKIIVAPFIFPPHCIGNQVGVLDAASRFGVYEEWDVNQIGHRPPSVPEIPELGGEVL